MIWIKATMAIVLATAVFPSDPPSHYSPAGQERARTTLEVNRGPMLVEIAVYEEPQIARAGGEDYLVYELHLTNFVPTHPMTISAVTVTAGDAAPGAAVTTLSGDQLVANFRLIGPQSVAGQPATLGPGQRAMVYVWLPLSKDEPVPIYLTHRVRLQLQGIERDYLIDDRPVEVSSAPMLKIRPPLTGGPWVAANGPTPSAVPAHNRLLYPHLGEIHSPQRFATDWVKLGPDGRMFSNDPTRNEDYPGYNEPVLAVADGRIAAVHDGVPDNTPPQVIEGLSQADRAGNYVIVELGDGVFAFYGHLRPGSITVSPGMTVREGQILGRVGNSGNSSAPHLHFHLTDGPSLGSSGLAFGFLSYLDHGPLAITLEELEAGGSWSRSLTSELVANDLPLGQTVITIPGR